jgi:hypothetical protein
MNGVPAPSVATIRMSKIKNLRHSFKFILRNDAGISWHVWLPDRKVDFYLISYYQKSIWYQFWYQFCSQKIILKNKMITNDHNLGSTCDQVEINFPVGRRAATIEKEQFSHRPFYIQQSARRLRSALRAPSERGALRAVPKRPQSARRAPAERPQSARRAPAERPQIARRAPAEHPQSARRAPRPPSAI